MLMWFASDMTGATSFQLLKTLGPVLYGCLAVSFFVFVRRGLNLESKVAFLATVILIFQPAALRESWDRYRTVLAMILFFATLTVMTKGNSKRKWIAVAILGILTVLFRDYIGVFLLITVLGFAVYEKKDRIASLIALSPSLAILFVIFNQDWHNWNYLSPGNPFGVDSYWWAVQDSLSIFAVCYLPFLPFILKGFRKNSLLTPMVGWLLLGSFSVDLFPWFAVPGYQRWLMLLVFPFSIYAALGLDSLSLGKHKVKLMTLVVLVLMVIGLGYSTGAFSYVGVLPNSYVPVNLVQSSIPWDQIDDVKSALMWLDNNAVSNSVLLSEERFFGWTQIYLQRDSVDIEIVPYAAGKSPFEALSEVKHDQVYLIWYSDMAFTGFKKLFSNESITIFEYEAGSP